MFIKHIINLFEREKECNKVSWKKKQRKTRERLSAKKQIQGDLNTN